MCSAHIIALGILLCVKTGGMDDGIIVDCSWYLFWFHINQTGNALLASQSEVTSSLQFLVVDTPTDLYLHSTVVADWSVSTVY